MLLYMEAPILREATFHVESAAEALGSGRVAGFFFEEDDFDRVGYGFSWRVIHFDRWER